MQPHRTPDGGLIDRTRPLHFSFDGQTYEGYEGDTLASALLANGVKLVGRSFKYHRPRGILSAGPEEPNALVELREGAAREPNTRATIAELFPGLAARSQNRFPSLKHDLLAINTLLAPIFGAGFYYKTFMWPAAFWERVYEPLIRRAAGLGRASGLPDPDAYEKQTAFADVLVIGAGPAGLAAALEAAQTGARVLIAEQDFALGGRLLSDRRIINGQPAQSWLQDTEETLRASANVRILTRTTITGVFDGGTYAGLERVSDHLPASATRPRQRHWRIVAKTAILATGAIERPLIFGNNDLPGIMLAGAVRSYINRFAVKPGSRAVVFSNNDDAATTISDLAAAGIEVAALVYPRFHQRHHPAGQWRQGAEIRHPGRHGRRHHIGLRSAGRLRRLEPCRPPRLPPRRQARVERGDCSLHPRPAAARPASGRRRRRQFSARRQPGCRQSRLPRRAEPAQNATREPHHRRGILRHHAALANP
jgi:sarcosine oxidase subunit alpha